MFEKYRQKWIEIDSKLEIEIEMKPLSLAYPS